MRRPALARVLVAGTVPLVLVAGALLVPRDLSTGGEAARPGVVVPDLPSFFDALFLGAVLVVTVAVVVGALAVSARLNPERVVRRRGPAGPLVMLVVLAFTVALFASSNRDPADTTRPARPAPATAPPEAAAREATKQTSRGLGWVLSAVVALAAAGVAVAAWRFARANVPEDGREQDLDRRLVADVEAAIEDLEQIADPRAAVVACYGRLRRVAQRRGIPIRRSDTALEVLETLGDRTPEVAPSAGRLVALFQEARFSSHRIDETMRRDALDALADIRDRLAAAV